MSASTARHPLPPSPADAATTLLPDWSWGHRLRLCILVLWLGTVWLYWLVLPLPPGPRRLAVAAPVLLSYYVLPLLFHPGTDVLTVMSVSYLTFRMPATKVLALCYGRGPLALSGLCQSLFTFLVICPVVALGPPHKDAAAGQRHKQQQRQGATPKAAGSSFGSALAPDACNATTALEPSVDAGVDPVGSVPMEDAQIATAPAAAAAGATGAGEAAAALPPPPARPSFSHQQQQQLLHETAPDWLWFGVATAAAHAAGCVAPVLVHAALAYGMLAMMGSFMAMTAANCRWRWGVDIAAPFRAPFQATSLADFWGRRWNIPQTAILKALVYEPIVEGRMTVGQSDATAPAAAAADAGTSDRSSRQGRQLQLQLQLQQQQQRAGGGGCGDAVDELCGAGEEGEAALAGPAVGGRSSRNSGGLRLRLHSLRGGAVMAGSGAAEMSSAMSGCSGDSSSGMLDGCSVQPATAGEAAATADPFRGVKPIGRTSTSSISSSGRRSSAGWMWSIPMMSSYPAGKGDQPAGQYEAQGCSRRRLHRAVATLAVFFFSGIEHEVFHWCVQRFVSWRWLAFFVLHGALMVAEDWLKRAWRGGGLPAPPRWLRTLLTLCVLEASAAALFFDVLLEPGVVARTTQALSSMVLMWA